MFTAPHVLQQIAHFRKLFGELNNAEVIYPGTEFQLVYHLGSYDASHYAQGVTATS